MRAASDRDQNCAGLPVRRLGGHTVGRRGDTRVNVRLVAGGRPRRDDEVRREGGTVADRVDDHLPLFPGKWTSDGLRHLQLAWAEPVGVADVRLDDLIGRDGDSLPAALDNDRHGTGAPVSGLRHRAVGPGRDIIVSLELITGGSPGVNHKIRGQGGAVALRVDRDRPLLARARTHDRLAHEQRTEGEAVGIADRRGSGAAARDGGGPRRATSDVDRHGAGAPVRGLGNHAVGWRGDTRVDLRLDAGGRPAGMTKSGVRAVPLQTVWITTCPCDPAAGPVIVFVTSSWPGRSPYVSLMTGVDDLTSSNMHRLPASLDNNRHGARVPVRGLCHRAVSSGRGCHRIAGSGHPWAAPAPITKSGVKAVPLHSVWIRDLPLLARSRAGNRLRDDQRAGGEVIGIRDVDHLGFAGADGHLLTGPGHHHRRCRVAAVGCLGDGAHRSGRDVVIGGSSCRLRGHPREC